VFDIRPDEFLIIALVALLVIGPERLPQYAAQARNALVRLRGFLNETKASVKSELGDDVDWAKLNPRQYDPRAIVRDAFTGVLPGETPDAPRQAIRVRAPLESGEAAPYDANAT